jgi:polar amino acid transport system ATP-binding protein
MEPRPLLEGRGLSKIYGDNEVLRQVDIAVHDGERLVVIGPSGSGKTTLLRCLNFLELADQGVVAFNGDEYDCDNIRANQKRQQTRQRLRQLRREVGMVFQHFNLFPNLTVLQNVIEAPIRVRGVSEDEAIQTGRLLLRQVHLSDKENAYPRTLSGGQKQRVAIARTLAMRPRVVLFDEVTSSLDPELIGEVLDTMRELANDGLTMIIVTHEMGFASQIGDRVIFMDHGRVIEEGSAQEVLRNPREERTQSFLRAVIERRSYDAG